MVHQNGLLNCIPVKRKFQPITNLSLKIKFFECSGNIPHDIAESTWKAYMYVDL